MNGIFSLRWASSSGSSLSTHSVYKQEEDLSIFHSACLTSLVQLEKTHSKGDPLNWSFIVKSVYKFKFSLNCISLSIWPEISNWIRPWVTHSLIIATTHSSTASLIPDVWPSNILLRVMQINVSFNANKFLKYFSVLIKNSSTSNCNLFRSTLTQYQFSIRCEPQHLQQCMRGLNYLQTINTDIEHGIAICLLFAFQVEFNSVSSPNNNHIAFPYHPE